MIGVKQVSFKYQKDQAILDNIEFDLKAGESLAILGNNGAGKSTMLKCLNRILMPQQGSVLVGGQNVLQMPLGKVAENMAFVEQRVSPGRLRVYDLIMLGRKPHIKWGIRDIDQEIVGQTIKQMKLEKMAGRFFDELSGGEQQKIMIARALVQEPKVLLLDEPTSSLDLKNQYEVLDMVSHFCTQKKIAVIMVIHDINLALRYCHKFLLIKNNTVYKYGDQSIIEEKTIETVYEIRAKIIEESGQKIMIPLGYK